MAESLPHELQEEYRAAFDFWDKEKKGNLTTEQFVKLMRSIGEDTGTSEASSHCSGGSIDFSAFLKLRQDKWAAARSGEVISHAFQVLDRDQSGYVNADDLRHLLVNEGEPLSSSEVEDLIRDAGGGSTINWREFVDTLMKKKS